METITVLSDPEVAKHIDFIETDRDGIYVHFKDGTVEFHAWKNSKLSDGDSFWRVLIGLLSIC